MPEINKQPTHDRMISAMPPYYRDSPQANAIIGGHASEIARRQAEMDDLAEQMIVSKATWAIDRHEEIFGITPNPSRPIEERRAAIIAKMRGAAPTTLETLRDVVNAFATNNDGDVTLDNPRYTIYAEIPADGAVNVGNMQSAVNEIKPAHLAFEVRSNISDGLILRGKEYGFGVPLPICNVLRCDNGAGIAIKDGMAVSTNERDFIVPLPITDRFKTDKADGVAIRDTLETNIGGHEFAVVQPITNVLMSEGD